MIYPPLFFCPLPIVGAIILDHKVKKYVLGWQRIKIEGMTHKAVIISFGLLKVRCTLHDDIYILSCLNVCYFCSLSTDVLIFTPTHLSVFLVTDIEFSLTPPHHTNHAVQQLHTFPLWIHMRHYLSCVCKSRSYGSWLLRILNSTTNNQIALQNDILFLNISLCLLSMNFLNSTLFFQCETLATTTPAWFKYKIS